MSKTESGGENAISNEVLEVAQNEITNKDDEIGNGSESNTFCEANMSETESSGENTVSNEASVLEVAQKEITNKDNEIGDRSESNTFCVVNESKTESSGENTISNEGSVSEVAQNEITDKDNEIGNGSQSNTVCEANVSETESSGENIISNEASVLEVAQNEITNKDNEIGNGSESSTFCEVNESKTESSGENTISNEASVLEVAQKEITNKDNEIGDGSESNTFCEVNESKTECSGENTIGNEGSVSEVAQNEITDKDNEIGNGSESNTFCEANVSETESSGENIISNESSILEVAQNEITNKDNEIGNGSESNTFSEANVLETESSGENTISNEASVLEVPQNEITNKDNEIANGSESNTVCEANVSNDSLGEQCKTNDTVHEQWDVECKGLMSNRELLKASSNEKLGGNEEKQLDEISNLHTSIAASESSLVDRSIKELDDVNNDIPKTSASVVSHELGFEKSGKSETVSSISTTKTGLVNEIHTSGKTKEKPDGLTEEDTTDQSDTPSYRKEENCESQISPDASSKSQVEENVHSKQIERLEKCTDGKGNHSEQINSDEKPAQTSEHNKSEQDIKDETNENVEPSSTNSTGERKCETTVAVLNKTNEITSPDVEKHVDDSSDNTLSKINSGLDQEVSRRVTRRSGGNLKSKSQVKENVHSEQIQRLEKSTDGKDNRLEQINSDKKPAQTSEHKKSEQDIKDKTKGNVKPSTNSTGKRKCEITAVAVLNKSNEIISPDVEKHVEDSSDNTLSKVNSGLDQEVSRRVTRRSGGNSKIQGINENEKSTKKLPERGIKQQTKSTNEQRQKELLKVSSVKEKIQKLKGKHIDISANDLDPVVMITRTAVNKNRKTKSVTPETKFSTRSSSRFSDKRLSDTELGGRFEKKDVEKNLYVDVTDCSPSIKKAIKHPVVKKKTGDEIIDSLKATSEKPHGEKKSRSQEPNKGGNILTEAEELSKEDSENTRTLRGNKRMNNMNSKDIKSESPVAKKQKTCDDSKIVETRVTRSGRHLVELPSEHKDEAKFPLVSRKTKTLSCKASKTSANKNTRSAQSSSISTPILLPQIVPIIDCDTAVDNSNDVIEIQESDPLAVSEGESEVSKQLPSTDFNLSGNESAPSTRRSLRKRGLEHPENVADFSESLVKKTKTNSKQSASLHVEKSVEEVQDTVNISSSEDDVIIISDSNETLKIGPKKKSPPKKSKKKKGLQNRTFKAPDGENSASHNPQQTKKQIVENRNSKCKR